MNEDLTQQLKYLRLTHLATNWEAYLRLASQKKFTQAQLLEHIVGELYQHRRNNAIHSRIKRAGIPEVWVMDTFPYDRQPKLNRHHMMSMYKSMAFMRERRNIIWMGPTGCGKTGLATSFLVHAIEQGHTGRFVTFADLIDKLYRSQADHSQERVLKPYLKCDCLLIDEIGYVEVEAAQVGLLFSLLNKRHRKKSTLLTTNLGFKDWGAFLKNEHLTAALLDRLTEQSDVINMKSCDSLRAKKKTS